jgi:hypothetical protein
MKRVALLVVLLGCRPAIPQPPVATAPPARAPAAEEIGSLRNARVALPRTGERSPLTYFAAELSGERRREVERLAPRLRIVTGLSREEALRRADEAHAVDAHYATRELLRAAGNLVWVQARSAGVERYLAIPELSSSGPRTHFSQPLLPHLRAAAQSECPIRETRTEKVSWWPARVELRRDRAGAREDGARIVDGGGTDGAPDLRTEVTVAETPDGRQGRS